MTDIDTDHEQQSSLWITGDKPVENCFCAANGFLPHAPSFQEKLKSLIAREADAADVVGALVHRIDVLEAEFDAIRTSVTDLLDQLDEPLSFQALTDRIQSLRDALRK